MSAVSIEKRGSVRRQFLTGEGEFCASGNEVPLIRKLLSIF